MLVAWTAASWGATVLFEESFEEPDCPAACAGQYFSATLPDGWTKSDPSAWAVELDGHPVLDGTNLQLTLPDGGQALIAAGGVDVVITLPTVVEAGTEYTLRGFLGRESAVIDYTFQLRATNPANTRLGFTFTQQPGQNSWLPLELTTAPLPEGHSAVGEQMQIWLRNFGSPRIFWDDITLEQVTAVPVPAPVWLLGPALGVLVLRRRRY
ncbi:MAG: hypothetical protein ACU85V_10280 [Gammaproteobacteria bacterium]